ncbi:MAG: phosphoribosylglycinamide formyltransferase [Deltaproteobacteria bacterium]|nr:phosphoribosylglycinamide formyltransferase [Deltaproteobacteria bacterium]
MTGKLRIGALASGGGSNVQSIIDQIEAGRLPAEMVLLLTDNPDAGVLDRAERHGIPRRIIMPADFRKREDHDRAMIAALKEARVELVILAGYMRIISPDFVRAFPGRIMNIHPALLPAFPGIHVQTKAADYGVRFSGCTVHFVDEGMDSGPIIIQAVVPVLPDDDGKSLGTRILRQEHRIYPEAIRLFAEGRLKIEGRRVRIFHSRPDVDQTMINPPPVSDAASSTGKD